MKKLFLLFLVIFLSGCIANTTTSTNEKFLNKSWSENSFWKWGELVGTALLIALFILVLAYFAGSFFTSPELLAWSKKEIGQLIYSCLIIIFVLALIASVDIYLEDIIKWSSPSPDWHTYIDIICCRSDVLSDCPYTPAFVRNNPCHFGIAKDYLQILYETDKEQLDYSLWRYGIFSILSDLKLSARAEIAIDLYDVSINVAPFLKVDVEYYNILIDYLYKNMIFIRIQQLALDYLDLVLVPFMIGMGLVLRIFSFSRKLGGTLIALGLSFYIVLPTFYSLMSAILFGFTGSWISGNSLGKRALFGEKIELDETSSKILQLDTRNQAPARGEKLICDENQQRKSEFEEFIDQAVSVFSNIKGVKTDEIGAKFKVGGALSNLAALMTFTVITPFIGLMLTLSSYKVLSPLIGGDVEIALLSRLI
jgi:hypothetical protein